MTEPLPLIENGPKAFREPPLILVDGSNVAHCGKHEPKIAHLHSVLGALSKFPLRTLTMVDASLRHKIDDPAGLETLMETGEIVQAPAGRSVDEFLLQLAQRKKRGAENVYILTNDRFPDKLLGEPMRRIAFLIVTIGDEEEVLFSPVIETVVRSTIDSA
jgi:hypothetical protein